jgi:hypothetical protein
MINHRPGTFMAIGRAGKGRPVIGQMNYHRGSTSARISLLMPADALDSMVLPGLIEYLASEAGSCGALHFIGEVDEGSCVYEALRRAGFSVYGWQRIWRFPPTDSSTDGSASANSYWRPMRGGGEMVGVRSLYQSLVPALVQPIEPPPAQNSRGLVCQRKGETMAFAELAYGPLGIWAQPFVHPAAEGANTLLADLVKNIPRRGKRPVYVCVRSYQGWLESALEELGGETGPRQALMVKHLAILQRVTQTLQIPAFEKGQAKHSPASTVLHSKTKL